MAAEADKASKAAGQVAGEMRSLSEDFIVGHIRTPLVGVIVPGSIGFGEGDGEEGEGDGLGEGDELGVSERVPALGGPAFDGG